MLNSCQDADRMPSHKTVLGHLGLTVPDVDAAAAWYEETFGWTRLMGPVDVTVADPRVAQQIQAVFQAPNVAFRQIHLLMPDGVALELFEFREPRESEGCADYDYWSVGLFHFCLVAGDIDALAARIVAFGGRQMTPVAPIFRDEKYRFCYCADPFGNVIELASHPHAESFGGREGY
jgi:catechol 2,3-dioxygenase-like lactoylglutathione lyase family enzyme